MPEDAPGRGGEDPIGGSAPAFRAVELADVVAAQRQAGDLYHEFLRVPSLSLGLYVLPAGATDPQQPHAQDEIYYVVGGRAVLRVDETDRPVATGTIAFVPAGRPHRFHSIAEELTLLVFFAPAETAG